MIKKIIGVNFLDTACLVHEISFLLIIKKNSLLVRYWFIEWVQFSFDFLGIKTKRDA